MVVSSVASDSSFRASAPQLWSPGQFTDTGNAVNFSVHPDGKRFAVLKAPDAEEISERTHVNMVQNWFEELKRLAPAGGNP
jgi:hypothetical protein